MDIHQDKLPTTTGELIALFQEKSPSFLREFYLSGGTGLALQLGHRESEDLDFFSQDYFSPQKIETELKVFGNLLETELADGTLNTFLNKVKLQFLEYPHPMLQPFIIWNGLQISSILDIACTKLQTVGARGSKKDFIDIYFLLKKFSLSELLDVTSKKYKGSNYSQTHILKSLVYFTDAEKQPMPRMHQDVTWEEMKLAIVKAVKSVSLV